MQATDHITLAVFPFEDLSLQKELGIFCRSFSSDLTTELCRFRQFHVISLPQKDPNEESFPTKQFESLETDYFIQGSFRCDKEMVRINIQLYNSNTRHMVWGNRLEGKLTGLSEMQDNLLAAVVSVLQQQINKDLLAVIRKRPKVEFRAYEHWLYGMEEVKKGSLHNDLIARQHFQQALDIQADYSLAYSGMSLTYFNEWSCQLWERWDISKTGAGEWAQKAIELDDHNYMASMVLGKIFLYEGAYDTAEYYFRKSLSLNANDPDTLMAIALYYIFLGLEKEAVALYEKAIRLNPFNADKYALFGVFIFFELGDYSKAASLIVKSETGKIADADAYYAAIYFYLNQRDKMQAHWDLFLATYGKLISKGKDFTCQEAIDWIMKISPYKGKSNLEPFLDYISNGSFEKKRGERNQLNQNFVKDAYFLKETAAWKLAYDGSAVQVPEVKGFYDICKMLSQPRQLFHCAEMMGTTMNGKGEKLLDAKSRKQYQEKILELQSEIQESENNSNFSRVEKLQEEYDS
jgi:TolB-like protein/tetratricopeptide (TPR) repeat protein